MSKRQKKTTTPEKKPKISSAFKKGLLIASLAIFLSSLPLIYGVIKAPNGMVFLGRRYLNSQDTPTYYSFIEQAKQGKILFQNLYTTETPNPSFLRPSYLLIGEVARIFNIPSPWAFHIFRILFGLIFFISIWFLLSYFFPEEKRRVLPLAIIFFSSGLGLALGKFLPNSTDLWIPESNTFLTLDDSPHFIFSQTLLVLFFGLFLKSLKTRKLSPACLGGMAGVLLAFDHPFALPTVYLTFFLLFLTHLIWQNQIPQFPLKAASILIAPSLLGAAYYYLLLKNPGMAAWNQQNVMPSPTWINYLSGFGLLVPLTIIGVPSLLKKVGETEGLLLLSWISATLILLYAPVPFQRRFSEGLHIPIAILATFGLKTLLNRAMALLRRIHWERPHLQTALVLTSAALLGSTNFWNLSQDIKTFTADRVDSYYYYLLPQEAGALDWIRTNIPQDKTILSTWFYGNLIPGFTARKVFLGHQVQTIKFNQKQDLLNSFFTSYSDEERQGFLQQEKIDYLFFGKDDYFLRIGDFKPEEKNYLAEIYAKEDVKVFSVEK